MKKIFILIIFIISSFLIVGSSVKAASGSLYLSPPSGTYTVDSTFSVAVKVNSGGENINAAEGTLVFNPDELRVVSLSKTGSIFSLWTTEPTFSNSTGNIVFGGGVPSTFTGTSGTIVIVNFKAEAVASAQVGFSSGSVLAADGKGTNILGNMNGGVYTLKSKITTPPAEGEEYVPPLVPGKAPVAPAVSSLTHPEENNWYSNNNPEFSWQLPVGVTGVSLLLHQKSTANPGPNSDGLMESKKIEDVADGIWYFHIKFRNQYGWGPITHRKVLIDTQAPEFFEVQVDNQGDVTNPSPTLHFKSSDALSGIEYYEVKIEEAELVQLTAATLEHNPYQIPPQVPGSFMIIAQAVDGAGNLTPATTKITIEPIGEAPVITEYPQRLNAEDVLVIKGTSSYPESTITVFVKREGGERESNSVETDDKGNWEYIHPKELDRGDYEVWVIAIDSRGAQSEPSEKVKIVVALPTLIKFGKIALDYLTLMTTLIVLIVGAVAVIFYTWYRVSVWRKRVRKETKEVSKSVTKAFKALREEVQEQVEQFDKKPGLNKREKKVRDKLKEALDISEEFIDKEIKDIEKELE